MAIQLEYNLSIIIVNYTKISCSQSLHYLEVPLYTKIDHNVLVAEHNYSPQHICHLTVQT